jgi:hypothetical protein
MEKPARRNASALFGFTETELNPNVLRIVISNCQPMRMKRPVRAVMMPETTARVVKENFALFILWITIISSGIFSKRV